MLLPVAETNPERVAIAERRRRWDQFLRRCNGRQGVLLGIAAGGPIRDRCRRRCEYVRGQDDADAGYRRRALYERHPTRVAYMWTLDDARSSVLGGRHVSNEVPGSRARATP